MNRRMAGLFGLVLVAGAITCGPSARAADEAEIRRRIDELKVPESQRQWHRIPWINDLDEGLRLAKEEHRPILIWASGADPMERC